MKFLIAGSVAFVFMVTIILTTLGLSVTKSFIIGAGWMMAAAIVAFWNYFLKKNE